MKTFAWTFKRFRFHGQVIAVIWHGERIQNIREEKMDIIRELERQLRPSDLDWFDDDWTNENWLDNMNNDYEENES